MSRDEQLLNAGFDKANAEAYGTIVENPFRAVAVAPLSTFSADVNTASYSNVRRFLTQGQLPPRDAVFLADLVNYFPYRYPEPTGDNPVSLTLDLAPCPWQPDHKLARIGVKARTLAPSETPRRNLVFLIDVSGSMSKETRLPLVKKSFELLVPRLTAADRVSIVTYAGDAGLKLPPTPGDQRGRILEVVRSLSAGGSTNGSGGIRLAYETARRGFIDGGANRVILCTDGDFNVGQTSESELVQLIEKERAGRVFLTVLGYGMGNIKDSTLHKLAEHGDGHYAYIDTIEEARKVFVEQGGALVCVAKDVKFQVEFNPARVTAYRLIGYENRILKDEDFKDDAKDAGDIGSGHTVTALYEVVPVGVKIGLPGVDPLKYQTPPQPAGGSDEWLTVKMRYKHPDGDAGRELAAVLTGTDGGGTMSEDFRFAAAVAEFGLVLRDSPYKGNANLADVLTRAEGAVGYDPNGHRKEFLDLVRVATGLRGQER
jgi:Ca-activated chloride channel family protein